MALVHEPEGVAIAVKHELVVAHGEKFRLAPIGGDSAGDSAVRET